MPLADLPAIIDSTRNLPLDQWLSAIQTIADDQGYFEKLGADHSAIFVRRSRRLLVTFETVGKVRNQALSDAPLGWDLIKNQDWSQLCLLSHSDTWFRDEPVYGYFDGLIDDGYFDGFDQVVFYGEGACAYAATAFSVAAPGSIVIALQPQATLDPERAGWDYRAAPMAHLNFSERYGYAPDMAEAAEQVFVLYDATISEDRKHADLFGGDNVTLIRCNHMDELIGDFLTDSNVLEPIIAQAMQGQLQDVDLHRHMRKRKEFLPYLHSLLSNVEDKGRPYLTALLCRRLLNSSITPRFQRLLAKAEKELLEAGGQLPDPLSPKSDDDVLILT